MKKKNCLECGTKLSSDALSKGYDYCLDCYLLINHVQYTKDSSGLKKCKSCNEILTTEEFRNGYDYHLKCYIALKGRKY
jgi:NMD protein affecting ribosome stability and mRNA decay